MQKRENSRWMLVGSRIVLFAAAPLIFAVTASAQTSVANPPAMQLTVQTGIAIRLIMTNNVRFRLHEPVRAQVTDPVYSFDREVIPPGTEVDGQVVGFRRPSRWLRV